MSDDIYQVDPYVYECNARQGDTFYRRLTLTLNNEAWPWNNDLGVRVWFVRSQIREFKESDDYLADLEEADTLDLSTDCLVVDVATNKVNYCVSSETMKDFPGDVIVYGDLEIYNTETGQVLTPVELQITVSTEITRETT